jgi:hypothetical protein
MDGKRWWIAGGAAGLLVLLAAGFFALTRLFPSGQAGPDEVAEITDCDADPTRFCIVSFGSDKNGRMVINFSLPDPGLPEFYVRVHHGGAARRFACRTVADFPQSVYCTGERTPLGETIAIEVLSIEDDALLARGTFVVGAFALPSPLSVSTTPGPPTITPGGPLDTPSPFPPPTLTPAEAPTALMTNTPDSYPNP